MSPALSNEPMPPEPASPTPGRSRSRARRLLRVAAAVLAVVCIGVVILLWTGAPPTAPVVQGQPLDFWVRELIAGTKERHARASEIIVADGAAHVEWLIRILDHEPSLAGRMLLRTDDWLPRRLSVRLHQRLRPYEIAVNRAGAARALGLAGDSSPEVIEALGRAIQTPDLRLAGEAAASLGQLGAKGTARLLVSLRDLPDVPRLIAISRIHPTNITAAAAVPVILREALREPNSRLLPTYRSAVARYGAEAVEHCYRALRGLDAASTERMVELARIAAWESHAFRDAWEEQWSSQDAAARSVGLQVFLRLQAYDIHRAIVFARGVCDPDPDVRDLGLQGLISVREKARRAVPILIEGLRSGSPEIRVTAAKALGQLGPLALEAKPLLEELARVADPAVFQAADEALTLLNGSPAGL